MNFKAKAAIAGFLTGTMMGLATGQDVAAGGVTILHGTETGEPTSGTHCHP